jgi:NADPH:quinone reductase-like Zn-dependent oxidoreductase
MSSIRAISKALVFKQHGSPSSVLKLQDIEHVMKHQQVMLKMLAAPINPSDINIIEGECQFIQGPIQLTLHGVVMGQWEARKV